MSTTSTNGKPLKLPSCLCGAWEDPESYGGDWDKSSDWCPLHGPLYRGRTLARLRRLVRLGRLSQEEYDAIKAQ